MDNLVNRHNRPVKEFRKSLPEVFKKTQFASLWSEGHIKANWSQYTGCQCGCSSGFRLTGLYGYNIFVDVEH